jgi:hypothetical protein
VAVDGDTVVVGAHQEDSNATGANGDQRTIRPLTLGRLISSLRTGGCGARRRTSKRPIRGQDDQFGYAVAIDGDTVVVGARREDSNATGVNGNASQSDNSAANSGAAYVFTRTAGVWSQQAYLKASNTGEEDRFGWAVAIEGNTVVVGAVGEASNGTNQMDNSTFAGGGLCLHPHGGGVEPAGVPQSVQHRGRRRVWLRRGHMDGDTSSWGRGGKTATPQGSMATKETIPPLIWGGLCLHPHGGVWSQQAYLKASNTGAMIRFGSAVAVDGDTVVVGACGKTAMPQGSMATKRMIPPLMQGRPMSSPAPGRVWSQQAYLKASNTNMEDEFGFAVAIEGNTVVVGAPSESSNGTGVNSASQENNSVPWSGAAYVFTRTGTGWSQQAYLKASNTTGCAAMTPSVGNA